MTLSLRMSEEYALSKKELGKAKREKKELSKKAVYWHNAIPNYDDEMRSSLNKDVQTTVSFRQLELNKDLHRSIKWNNWINFCVSILNLILFSINLYLIIKNLN